MAATEKRVSNERKGKENEMKRNVLYWMMLTALLSLSSCGKDGANGDSPLNPPDGMVTLRLSTLTDNGATATREGDTPIPKNTKVLMIAFTSDGIPKGYELISVKDNGAATIELPENDTFKLVFYSLQKTDAQFDPGDYIGNLSSPSNSESHYYDLSGASYTLKATPIPVTVTSGYTVGVDKQPADAICACNDNVSTSSGFPDQLTVMFRHLFAQLTWELDVNPNQGGTITYLNAGFYPRYAKANLVNLGKMTSTESGNFPSFKGVWTGYDMEATPNTYFHAECHSATYSPEARRFIPVTGETNVQIHIKELAFGDNSITATDYDIPILNNQQKQISFEPGKSYKITSKLSAPTSSGQLYITDFVDESTPGTAAIQ
jgi:hypothetical protein